MPSTSGAPRRPLGRAVALLLALVLVLSTAALPAAAQPVDPDPDFDQVEADAAAYLADVHGNADPPLAGGSLSDIIFALTGADEQLTVVAQSRASLEAALTDAVDDNSTDPGVLGKGLLGLLAVRGAPDVVDDVEAALRGLITESDGPSQGRIGDASTFVQALGVMALSATRDGAPASTTRWLADQRCPDGGWVWSGACPTSGGEVDVTALALQALRDDAVQASVRDGALTWLLDQQDATDGSFGGNANSTGLAGQTLRALGEVEAADYAATFIANLQIPAGDPNAGSIQYTPTSEGSLFAATTQGMLALGAPAMQDLGLDDTAPTGACSDDTGVTVVVDLTAFDDGEIVQGCAPGDPADGLEALTSAGFDIITQDSDFGAFVCAIEGLPRLACAEPWAGSYWSYHSGNDDGSWSGYGVGASFSDPAPGDVEGWAWSAGDPPGTAAPVIDGGDPGDPGDPGTPTGPTGACTGPKGVTVVVDFAALGGGIQQGCAVGDPANGLDALQGAGFSTVVDSSSDFGAYVCAIDGKPTLGCDEPFTGPYWSYHSGNADGSWSSHTIGASSFDPTPADVEGWAYTTGAPPGVAAPVVGGGTGGPAGPDPTDPDPDPTDPDPTDPDPTDPDPTDPVAPSATDLGDGERCDGVAVVVDLTAFEEGVPQRCVGGDPADGLEALELAGFDVTTRETDFGPLVCEIDRLPVNGCVNSQRQAGYWAYFSGEPDGTWTTSPVGAADADPDSGAVEGWRYGNGEPPAVTAPGAVVRRLAGYTRITTAIEISRTAYDDGAAGAVVLARADAFPDALAGTPLAVQADAPLLVTGAEALDPSVVTEIKRVLPPGGTVHVLGGPAALGDAVASELLDLGFVVQRLAGHDRIETAIAIAGAMGDPARVLLTTASDFPDGLAAGAAAGAIGDAAVLLTSPDAPHPAVDAYLAGNPDVVVTAVGGPAARAYPAAVAVAGETREQTAIAIADAFFEDFDVVGIARRDAFADALAGGADIARRGGPLLITPTTSVDPRLQAFLCGSTSPQGIIYGGDAALDSTVSRAIARALTGDAC